MGYELWGMQGVVLVAFIIGVAFVLNWATKKKNYLKFIPFSPKGLGIIGILLIAFAGYSTAWWGYETLGLPSVGEPDVTPGVTFEAEGSESDANLSYDQGSRVFTCSFVENTSADNIGGTLTPYTTIDTVTFTITVFRTDLLALTENAVAKIEGTVPTFYGKDENSSTLYWPVDKDSTSQKYEIAFTPAGGSARDAYNHFTVGSGGSKAITIVADTYHIGLAQLDNFQSKDVVISITGLAQTFTLRYTKTGEVA